MLRRMIIWILEWIEAAENGFITAAFFIPRLNTLDMGLEAGLGLVSFDYF